MKDNLYRHEQDVTPQPVRDLFDDIAEQEGTPKHSKFVLCRPDYVSTKIPNNVFMEGKDAEPIDVDRAVNQHDRVAHILEALGVEVLEMPPAKGAQDMVYCANIGIAIEPYIVLAKYKAPGRSVEVAPAKKFFEGMGYNCIQPPYFFEGEADLKLWKQGYYFGGFGLFSDPRAFKWIEKTCGVKIIQLKEVDPKSFHLDCSLMVIDEENFIVNKSGLAPESIKILQKLGNVHFTPEGTETCGCTNGVIVKEKHIYLSGAFNQEQKEYRKASEWLLETMDKFGLTTIFVDVDSWNASGADLSCGIFHLTFDP